MIILKFSQHQWIVKIWNNCFLLLFLKLFAAYRFLETYVMRDEKLFASFVFLTKNWYLLNSPNINKNLLFEVIVVFCYFFRFSHMHIVWWGLNPWKEGFTSVSLLPTKKLGRSSHDVTMTHYNVILILFLFRFAANAQDLQWDNFFVLTMNRRGVIRIYLL